MRTIETTVYTFDELDECAKEKAREWYRSTQDNSDFGIEHVIEDACNIGDLIGIDMRQTRRIIKYQGERPVASPIYEYLPSVSWDLYHGAWFTSRYQYKKGSCKAVRKYAPMDTDLHDIADGLYQLQKSNWYGIWAHTGESHRGNAMYVDVDYDPPNYQSLDRKTIDTVVYWIEQFANWIYSRIEAEYEYRNSDDVIDDSIRINEYEFTIQGEIA
jgi:hypothetical protein